MNRKIVEKQYYAFRVRIASPLCVSSGLAEMTDCDIIRNNSGQVFVPATSIAGVFKEALELEEKKDGIMGFSDGEDGKMSSMLISDLYFDQDVKISVRDNVALTAEKTVENKFDCEIIETGAQGTIYIQCLVREGENAADYTTAVKKLVVLLRRGQIRFGRKTRRGFGRIEFVTENIYYCSFGKDRLAEYLAFTEDSKGLEQYDRMELSRWIEKTDIEDKIVTIRVPLKLCGGISIRRYSAKPQVADYEHITCDGKPVIPGSSWNGAIRADVRRILTELHCKVTDEVISQWFGSTSNRSILTIDECVIENAVRMPMTRNKINRFNAATIDGALYKEMSYFGGNTTLELRIEKDESKWYQALIGVLRIAVEDLCRGYIAVGGLAAVGRGVFDGNGPVEISEECPEAAQALYALIKE